MAIGFVLAFVLGYAADRVRLPPLVGYLIAGVLMGPFTPGFEADAELAAQLAEMGVILLMFGVGLHFSASDLLAVKGLAVPGAVVQIVLATTIGFGLCSLMGFSPGAGIVIGLSLSVASTVVLLKALEERNLVNTSAGRVAIGWLIVEDLAMVLALVLLPALASLMGASTDPTGHGAAAAEGPIWLTLAITLGKVAAFAAVAILLGPRVVPWVLTQVARTGSRELFTLSVLAIALGIAYGSAEIFGVSFALGAFFAGVVLSESHFSHRAAANSLPLQDAFSVLFFVSVGMLFDPTILVTQPLEVLGVLAVIILGKAIIGIAIVLLLRYPLDTALLIGAGLAQIGEFSFILAGLGVTTGLIPPEGRDLVLAGAILSITLNPLVFSVSAEIAKWAKARRPALAGYGRQRQLALSASLEANRKRGEEREAAHKLRIQGVIDTFPLLSRVGKQDLEELLLLFKPMTASPGDRVIRAGDRGDSMFFIASGAVEVHVNKRDIRLEAGTFFGEMALLDGSRRTADVTAVDFCQFLVLARRDFGQFMARHPGLRTALKEMAEQRRAMNSESADERAARPAGAV
jgi:CPA2 family monovalent cation:H+ antiporter-2